MPMIETSFASKAWVVPFASDSDLCSGEKKEGAM